MPRGLELALVGALLGVGCVWSEEPCPPNAACAATRPPGVTATADIPFRDEGATAQSGHEGGAAIDAVASGPGTRITVYQGEQGSGGYAIRVERITRAGDELRVHARFAEPPPGSLNTMALTSPAHTVIVDASAAEVVLLDQASAERARTRRR